MAANTFNEDFPFYEVGYSTSIDDGGCYGYWTVYKCYSATDERPVARYSEDDYDNAEKLADDECDRLNTVLREERQRKAFAGVQDGL